MATSKVDKLIKLEKTVEHLNDVIFDLMQENHELKNQISVEVKRSNKLLERTCEW